MAVKFRDTQTEIRNAFPSIPEDRSFPEFIENVITDEKTGTRAGGAFGTIIRDILGKTQQAEVDFSVNTLIGAGWSRLEAGILNEAFHLIMPKHLKSKNLKVRGDYLDILGGYKSKDPWLVHGIIFKDVLKKAFELINDRYQGVSGAKELNAAEIAAIHNDLKDAARNKEPFDLVYAKLTTGTSSGKSGKIIGAQLEKLAYKRIGILAGELKGPRLDVHAGHLEGHENYRLASVARVAAGAYSEGFINIDDRLVQQVAVTVNLDKETVHSLFKVVYDRANTVDGAYAGTKVTQHSTMELGFLNVDKEEEKETSKELGKELRKQWKKWAEAKHTAEDLAEQGNSPSIIQIVEDFLIRSITGNKARSLKRKPKKKLKKKYKPLKFTVKGSTKALRQVLKPKKRVDFSKGFAEAAKRAEKFDDIDLFSTQNLINQILAINVEEQMADSGSTDGRLRYQTGRFADSAKLLTLTRAQAGVLAGTYTYMRNPYDVFLPGHKMATPKRDPRIYVEGAIREAAITVLKNRFPGINVELV